MIAKLRYDAALYFPYEGPYAGHGKRKKYGEKLDYQNISPDSLPESCIEKDIETKIYQMNIWHKKFADLLNVVVIVKSNLKTQAVAHVVFFSSNVELAYDALIDSDHLRCQIECNVRDAKQYWGLEDFMTYRSPKFGGKLKIALSSGNERHPEHDHRARR